MYKPIEPHTDELLLEKWIFPYGIPNFIQTKDGLELVGKYFS